MRTFTDRAESDWVLLNIFSIGGSSWRAAYLAGRISLLSVIKMPLKEKGQAATHGISLLAVLLGCGLRLSEVVHLKVSHL